MKQWVLCRSPAVGGVGRKDGGADGIPGPVQWKEVQKSRWSPWLQLFVCCPARRSREGTWAILEARKVVDS